MSQLNSEQTRTRRLTGVALALLLVAGGIGGSAFYLRHQSQATTTREAHIAEIEAFARSIEPTDPQVKQRVAQFRVLREKWKPWALQNKVQLQAMLNDKSANPATLEAVWQVTPANPDRTIPNFTLRSLEKPGVKFGWQPGSRRWKPDDKDKPSVDAERQRIFGEYHDIVLSSSINTGRSKTVFWASGRITQNDWVENPKQGPDDNALIQAEPKELEPPYEFLD